MPPVPQMPPRKLSSRWWQSVLLAFIITRVVVLIGAYAPGALGIQLKNAEGEAVYNAADGLAAQWLRWDANWYTELGASLAFQYVPESSSQYDSTAAFFPLYPVSIHLVSRVLGGNVLLAGMLISNLSFFVALLLLYRLTAERFSEADARRAVFYLAAFPTAFFFSAAYSESLYLLLVVGCVFFARRGEWGWAALCGAGASATRLPGSVLLLIAALVWLEVNGLTLQRLWNDQRAVWSAALGQKRAWLLIACIPLGFLAYMLFLYLTTGTPLAWLQASAAWGRSSQDPISTLVMDIGRVLRGETLGKHTIVAIDAMNIALVFIILAMLPVVWRLLSAAYAVYVGLMLFLPLLSRTESMGRYTLVMFPLFMVLGYWGRRPTFDRALRVVFLPLLALLTALFINWVFIG